MPHFSDSSPAFGHPGIDPRWTQGNKDGVGTAYSVASRVWFTLWNGAVTETYYPTLDRPQIRDWQYLISDGESFFHEEKRHLQSQTRRLFEAAPAYEIVNRDGENRYQIEKTVICDPHLSCVLQRVRLTIAPEWENRLQIYTLCAPHMEVSGFQNDARVVEVAGRRVLCAQRCGTWLALGATVPYVKLSAGFAGQSDGWTDLNDNFQMDWQFDAALDGNVALTGQIDLSKASASTCTDGKRCYEWLEALSFGDNFHGAATTLFQALDVPFEEQLERFDRQWQRTSGKTLPLGEHSGDGGKLARSSINVLLSHEDKTFAGAFIASLSIPWGEAKFAVEVDGYHLVWPRDMVNSASGLLAAGDSETPLRALIYLAASQQSDGGFPQNFWVNAEPHWTGIQLDEVSFPILLAHYLGRENALRSFDPTHMVLQAAKYLIEHGPATQQERWEENAGYSPSTLAVNIAALVIAGGFARAANQDETARFIEDYADWLESKLETWTTTGASTWSDQRIYARINPIDLNDTQPNENLDEARLTISNRAPDLQHEFAARDIVDGGCLHLARFGIRSADDPILTATIDALDKALKVETPRGACWRRYPHDGYGQRDDGSAFDKWGVGRAWPLLTGERAHFELARHCDWKTLRSAMENFASSTGLLPEQVWDSEAIPAAHMEPGGPTGSAQPLVWAHAEYLKLLRSIRDNQPFDFLPEVAARYIQRKGELFSGEVWKLNRQPRSIASASTCRVILNRAFTLRLTTDDWASSHDIDAQDCGLDLHFCDIVAPENASRLEWTFRYGEDEWEGRNFVLELRD